MIERNAGCEFDVGWLSNVNINLTAVKQTASDLLASRELRGNHRIAWLLKAITCIDLTTLAGDDTDSNVSRLCMKACRPLSSEILNALGFNYDSDCPIHTAAVCVYPSKVPNAVSALRKLNFFSKINVASVATGFPCGQTPLSTRLDEIKFAISQGAKEIDIVIDRSLVLTGRWHQLYQEVQQMRTTCGSDVHMKAILACGELGSLTNVYKASMVAMMAGSDFVKTSTGKEAVNATLPFGIVMSRAIADYYENVGYKVGLKPAGGIKTANDALSWLIMVKEMLGNEWLTPELFRFGASGLLLDIEKELYHFVTNCYSAGYEFVSG